MATIKLSLPETLKSFVDKQVAMRGYDTNDEYVRELIRKEQDRERLRTVLLDGANSPQGSPAGKPYFETLRKRVRRSNAT
jgi:antitoxin ParD1/3/4